MYTRKIETLIKFFWFEGERSLFHCLLYIKEPEKKTFVFSLDNKKIYNLKDGDYASVFHGKINGPCFGGGRDIAIDGNPLKENKLYTRQYSYDYKYDENALSEYQSPNKIKALEYEVFQVIFY